MVIHNLKEERKVYSGSNTSVSIRTTVPQIVCQLLDLKAGGQLNWNIEIDGENVKVTVEKAIK